MMSAKASGSLNNDLESLKLPPIHKNGLGQPQQDYGLPQKHADGLDRRHQLERSLQYPSSGLRPQEVYHAAK